MKKILLFGDPNSLYITQYIEYVLEPLGFEIYMQTGLNDASERLKAFFSKHRVNFIHHYKKNERKVFYIPLFGRGLRFIANLRELKKKAPFDVIHVQFVTPVDLFRARWVRRDGTKSFASFWGSDLLRASKKVLLIDRFFLNCFDNITADTYFMVDKYNQSFPKAKNKLNIIYYGVSLLEYVDNYEGDKTSCKISFDIPKEKTVISIGYNARWQQQHDKVLEQLKQIKDKDKYYIILQMTYGDNSDNPSYVSDLLKKLKESGFDYKILSDFLSMDDLAKLRIATDIFVNAQTTDAFCNSIKEYMYAQTQIISASWLHYPEIDMFPLYVNEFSDFSEISLLLEKPIDEEKLLWNKRKIKEESTWKSCCNKWAELYATSGNIF